MGFSRFDEREMMMMKKKKAKLGGPLGNDLKRRDSIFFLMSRQTFGFIQMKRLCSLLYGNLNRPFC